MEIGRAAKILRGGSAGQRSAEICVQAEDVINVERIGGDDQLLAWIPAAGLEPRDIFISGYIRIFAVDALAGPIGGPVGCARRGIAWFRKCRAA